MYVLIRFNRTILKLLHQSILISYHNHDCVIGPMVCNNERAGYRNITFNLISSIQSRINTVLPSLHILSHSLSLPPYYYRCHNSSTSGTCLLYKLAIHAYTFYLDQISFHIEMMMIINSHDISKLCNY